MEENSKKDHRALLNQGEEDELVSLPFIFLVFSKCSMLWVGTAAKLEDRV